MKNEIFSGIIVPASGSEDGETPTRIFVTEEANGFAIWFGGFTEGINLLTYSSWAGRDRVIEAACAALFVARLGPPEKISLSELEILIEGKL